MTDPVLAALTAACPASRPGSAADAVAGVTPRFAASPASVAEASAVLHAATEHDLAVVPRGSGSKLDWGAPPRRCDLVVDTLRLDQVLEHAAGDLVARVQAGVSLDRLGEVLDGAGQQLSLDAAPGVPGPDGADGPDRADGPDLAARDGSSPGGGTVGGALATGAAGPRRLRYGTPRDLVIGVTVIRADGTVAHSGGKVVKNVAGYDLGRLFTGSFGTLGLIVEAVFRLHPRPATVAYVTLKCADAAGAHRAVAAAAASVLAPSAIEIDRPARGRPVTVGVLLEGGPAGAGERVALMSDLLGAGAATRPDPPAWWGWRGGAVPAAGDGGGPGGPAGPAAAGTLIRVAFWASALSRVLGAIDGAAQSAGLDPAVGGSAAAGVVYAAAGADASPAAVAAFVSGLRAAIARGEVDLTPESAVSPDSPPVMASAVVVRAPAAVRDLVDPWGPVPSLPLMRAVKDQFDPGHRMAPGRFAGGILWTSQAVSWTRAVTSPRRRPTACTAASACPRARPTSCGARRWTRLAAAFT
jgi:glycolate oxidase FAD binding subunit